MKRTLKECSTKKTHIFLKEICSTFTFLTLKGGYFDPPSHPLQGFSSLKSEAFNQGDIFVIFRIQKMRSISFLIFFKENVFLFEPKILLVFCNIQENRQYSFQKFKKAFFN